MNPLLEWIGLGLMTVGVFFFLAAGIGVLRMPDAFTRGHTGGKADSPGFMFCLVGAWILWLGIDPGQSLRLLLLLVFMLATNPIVIHSILRHCRDACVGMMPETGEIPLDADPDGPGRTRGSDPNWSR